MRALIVDDLQSMRHFLAMCLAELADLEIDHADNGVEALRRLEERAYDVVLSDLDLPGLDGVALVEALRARTHWPLPTAIIVTGAAASDATLQRLAELEVHFLRRPVRAEEVRERVAALSGLPRVPRPPPRSARAELTVRFGERARTLPTRDLNALGAFLVAEELEPVGSVGVASVPAAPGENAEPIEVDCRVVHVRPQAMGPELPRGFAVRFEPATGPLSATLARAFTGATPSRPTTDALIADLTRLPLFRDLDGPELRAVRDLTTEQQVPPGQVVLREGDPSDAFYVVRSGTVAVTKGTGTPQAQELAVLRPGDFFGEMGVLLGAPRSATATACEPTVLLRIARTDLIALLREHPTMAAKIEATMLQRYASNLASLLHGEG